MKGCKKKTAFFRQEDIAWVEEYLIKSAQADNVGAVLRNALSEFVEKRKKDRMVNYFRFLGEENSAALQKKAEVLGMSFDDYIKDVLIKKSQEPSQGQFD